MYERQLLKSTYRIWGTYCFILGSQGEREEVRFEDEVRAGSAEEAVEFWYQKHASKAELQFWSIDPLN